MKRSSVDAKVSEFFGAVPIRLPVRNDLHLARKTWHMGMGLFIVFCYLSGISRNHGVLLLGFFLALDLFFETARLRSPIINEKILRVWGPVMRAHEVTQMSTIPHYIAAALLAVAIFPKPVAVLSILYLACGDPMASLFGILYGHKGPKISEGKSLIGTAAGVLICALLTFVYLKSLAMPEAAVWTLSIIGGFAGGMAELLPFDVDDNFTIPVISGFVMWLAFMVVGF